MRAAGFSAMGDNRQEGKEFADDNCDFDAR